MRHSDLVLLGLLSGGPRHGYELSREIESTRLRAWARISQATVYRRLQRLEEEGCLEAEVEKEGPRPERTIYRLTRKGEERLAELVRRALRSESPVYSDRLVGAAFSAVALPPARRRELLDAARERLEASRKRLRGARGEGASPLGQAIIDFYVDVVDAETRLLGRIGEIGSEGAAGERPVP